MSFEPANAVERALLAAIADPAQRAQFYRELAGADIFFPIRPDVEAQAERPALNEDSQVQIPHIDHRGVPHIPIFTSESRLRAVVPEGPYAALNTLAFLRLVPGAHLALNPGSDYGKAIAPDEAAALLDGSIFQMLEARTVPQGSQVVIGQPANYPFALAEALSQHFKKSKQVKRAWLAHFFDPGRDEKAHTLVAIDTTDTFAEVAQAAAAAIAGVAVPDPPVDFVPVTGGGLEDYFLKQSKPFYTRKTFGVF